MTTVEGGTPITVRYAEPTTWQAFAVCRGMSPSLFFPGQGESDHDARAVCGTCPVQAPCLAAALDQPEQEDHGVWGGTSRRERRTIRHPGWKRVAA